MKRSAYQPTIMVDRPSMKRKRCTDLHTLLGDTADKLVTCFTQCELLVGEDGLPQAYTSGVYALYLVGDLVYVGSATVGGRKGKIAACGGLRARLKRHLRSINASVNIAQSMISYRFIELDAKSQCFSKALEDILITRFQPLWNTTLQGFGCKASKKELATTRNVSVWDMFHYGRYPFVQQCVKNTRRGNSGRLTSAMQQLVSRRDTLPQYYRTFVHKRDVAIQAAAHVCQNVSRSKSTFCWRRECGL